MWIQAKAVSVEEYGKDLEGVQALQRKQEEVERDMTALQTQLEVRVGWEKPDANFVLV